MIRQVSRKVFRNVCTLTPLLIASMAVTSCSGSRPQSEAVKAPNTVESNAKVMQEIPVVYEKRTPKKAIHTANRRFSKSPYANTFNKQLSNAALERLRSRVRYDGSYLKIAYPGGDVPKHIGVCTDVVIRSYRKLGIDLQEQVHRDMSVAFQSYPNPRKWGLSKPDTNIDHRRVYNLRHFFQRRGAALPVTHDPRNYKPGDLVSWMVGPDLPHIGVVVNKPSKADPNRLMIVHNIANGPQLEDILFAFPITGHYRYTPAHMGNIPSAMYAKAKNAERNYSTRNYGMSHDQLVQAANLLGAQSNHSVKVKSSPQAQPEQNNLLDQVVRLDTIAAESSAKTQDGVLTLANLSSDEITSLITKKN